LHLAVIRGVEGKVKILIEFAKKRIDETRIFDWVNGRTNAEKWTPLHYACFSSNMEAIYQLIDNQADIYAVNKSKLNMLHVAA
jgi:ankyrin repeat protein